MDFPTIVAISVVGIVIGAIVISLIVAKKKGKNTCSCGCQGCAMAEMCHSKKNEKTK